MSIGGRARERDKVVRRMALAAGALVLLTLLFLLSGHWILTVIFGVAAAVAVWLFVQARAVR